MIEIFSVVFAIGFFGLLTQRSVLGALLSLQAMTTSTILAMVMLAKTSAVDDLAMRAALSGRAQDAGLVLMVIFQLQSLAALVFATRLHYLKVNAAMGELDTMRN